MKALKGFKTSHSLAGFFILSVLFYFSQAISSVFADGTETPAAQAAQVIPSAGMEGSKLADITSEVRLGHEDWEKMQRAVHETVERHLVGRKFIEVYGPLGAGVQCVPLDTYAIPPGPA